MSTFLNDESERGIRVSRMATDVQGAVEKLNLDVDGDGSIDGTELEILIRRLSLLDSQKDNSLLRNLVAILVLFLLLMTGCVFGASITAARLSKDTSVDPLSGIMYAKGSDSPIQTEPVAIRKNGVTVNQMTTNELDVLNEIILDNGSIKFHVKGYAKSLEKNQVALIVEGGSLIYGEEGLVAATGMAETMFNLVYPDDAVSVEEGVRRTLRELNRDERNQPDTISGFVLVISGGVDDSAIIGGVSNNNG